MPLWKPVRVGHDVRYAYQGGLSTTGPAPAAPVAPPKPPAPASPSGFVAGAPSAGTSRPAGPLGGFWSKVQAFMQSPARAGWVTRANQLKPITAPPEVLASAPKSPILDWLASGLPKDLFKGVTILAAQHGLESQETLVAKFIELGADPRDIYFAAIPYSADPKTLKRLAQYGVNVIQAPGATEYHERGLPGPPSEDAQSRTRRERLFRAMKAWESGTADNPYQLGNYEEARKFQLNKMINTMNVERPRPGSPILVLDDGGLILRRLHEQGLLRDKPPDVEPNDPLFWQAGTRHMQEGGLQLDLLQDVTGVEQTTRGITELSQTDLETPVVNVAASKPKDIEADFVAESVWRGMLDMLAELGIRSAQGKTVVQAGYGRVGSRTADIAKSLGFRVVIAETSPERREEAKKAGFDTANSLEEAAPQGDIVLGMTGRLTLTQAVLEKLKDDAVVASGSSGEIEGDVHFLARRHTGLPREVEVGLDDKDVYRNLGPDEIGGIHTHFLNDKRFFVAQGLRPVNFNQGPETLPLQKIELTRATMFAGAVQALMQRGHKGLQGFDGDVEKALVERYEASPPRREVPAWPTGDGREARRAQWKTFTDLLARKASLGQIMTSVNVFEAAHGADAVFPPTLSDASRNTGVVAKLPGGELILASNPVPHTYSPGMTGLGKAMTVMAPALLQVLPFKDETPRRLELLGREGYTLTYGLQTVDAAGKKRVHVFTSPEVGEQFSTAPAKSEIKVLATYDDAEISSVFVRDRREGQKLSQFTSFPARIDAFNSDTSVETRLLIRTPQRTVDVGMDGPVAWDQRAVAAYGDRVILENPLRVAVRLDGKVHEVPLPKDLVSVRELTSHLNSDLIRAVNRDGNEVLLPLRWPVQWRSTAWPAGDSERGREAIFMRSVFSPQKPQDKGPHIDAPKLGDALPLLEGRSLRRLRFDGDAGAWDLRLFNPKDVDEADAWETVGLKSP